jgi:hypothetical protein
MSVRQAIACKFSNRVRQFVCHPALWSVGYTFVDKLPSVGRLGRNSLKVLAEIMAETGRS